VTSHVQLLVIAHVTGQPRASETTEQGPYYKSFSSFNPSSNFFRVQQNFRSCRYLHGDEALAEASEFLMHYDV